MIRLTVATCYLPFASFLFLFIYKNCFCFEFLSIMRLGCLMVPVSCYHHRYSAGQEMENNYQPYPIQRDPQAIPNQNKAGGYYNSYGMTTAPYRGLSAMQLRTPPASGRTGVGEGSVPISSYYSFAGATQINRWHLCIWRIMRVQCKYCLLCLCSLLNMLAKSYELWTRWQIFVEVYEFDVGVRIFPCYWVDEFENGEIDGSWLEVFFFNCNYGFGGEICLLFDLY